MKHIEIKKNKVRTIYLELDDKCAGQIRMSGSDIKKEETCVYIYIYI